MKSLKKILALAPVAVLCLGLALLTGCGAKKYPMQVTVVNRTTYPIADIRIILASHENWGPNLIETTLNEGKITEIDLGKYTEDQLSEGFHIQILGEDGEPIDPDYDPLLGPTFFDNGDWLILAPPDSGYFMFMDTKYNMETYDRRIADCYDDDGKGDVAPDDGKGDVISDDDGKGDIIPDDGKGDVIGSRDKNSPNKDLYQVAVSEFSGTWYHDGDPSASTYVNIDRKGNWSYYERANGEAEATEMDHGTFTYSAKEASVYYANSSVYSNVSYRVFDFDDGILVWGDNGTYERIE